jgi:hypothetical protein
MVALMSFTENAPDPRTLPNSYYPFQPDRPASFGSGYASEAYQYQLAAPFLNLQSPGRVGINLSIPAPVVHYSFDDLNELGRDDSVNDFTGILTGVTASPTGVRGGAANFITDTSILAIGSTGVDLGSEWTASAWFYGFIDSPNANSLFSSSNVDSQAFVDGLNRLGVFTSALFPSNYVLNPSELAAEWHQMTVVGSGNQTHFYIDGQFVSSVDENAPGQFRFVGNIALNASYRFAEQIDEVYLFAEALTAAQVRQHYQFNLVQDVSLPSAAFGLESAIVGEHLSDLRSIGDFNKDGREDFIVSSTTTSYVLFGPLALDAMERVDQYAEIVISQSALGRPASRFGDINGDGVGDLAFIREEKRRHDCYRHFR